MALKDLLCVISNLFNPDHSLKMAQYCSALVLAWAWGQPPEGVGGRPLSVGVSTIKLLVQP